MRTWSRMINMPFHAVQLCPIGCMESKRNISEFDLPISYGENFLRMVHVNLTASQVENSICVKVHRIFLGRMYLDQFKYKEIYRWIIVGIVVSGLWRFCLYYSRW